jgi:hypothetical protein
VLAYNLMMFAIVAACLAVIHVAFDERQRRQVKRCEPGDRHSGRTKLRGIFDGEIVVLDSEGRPRFYDLLRVCRKPVFYVLTCSGSVVRTCGARRRWPF